MVVAILLCGQSPGHAWPLPGRVTLLLGQPAASARCYLPSRIAYWQVHPLQPPWRKTHGFYRLKMTDAPRPAPRVAEEADLSGRQLGNYSLLRRLGPGARARG